MVASGKQFLILLPPFLPFRCALVVLAHDALISLAIFSSCPVLAALFADGAGALVIGCTPRDGVYCALSLFVVDFAGQ
jgi:3-oxoacyl-[acyl-carrier-protein] synthase III